MWTLKPASDTIDVAGDDEVHVDDSDDTKDSPGTQAVPNSSRVTVLDSDSEEAWDESSIRNPLTPRLRPQDPDFGFTESLLLRPIEVMAARMLQREQHPVRDEILELFAMMPVSGLRRSAAGEGGGVRYLVGGASPRSNSDILTLCTDNPFFTCVVNRFIYSIAPQHKYTSFVIRQGCSGVVHRDLRNGPFRSMIVNLSAGGEGEGLWVHDRLGDVMKNFGDRKLPGVVLPLNSPVYLDARRHLHAGHVPSQSRAPARVILIAFSTLNLANLGRAPLLHLLSLGFPLPDHKNPHYRCDMNDFQAPVRLRQMSIEEAVEAAQQHPHQDVIEVLDSQEDRAWQPCVIHGTPSSSV